MNFRFQLLDLRKSEVNTLDQSVMTPEWLELVNERRLQTMEGIWVEKCFQDYQIDQLRNQIKLSLTSNIVSEVLGAGTESFHLEWAGGIAHLHRCSKM